MNKPRSLLRFLGIVVVMFGLVFLTQRGLTQEDRPDLPEGEKPQGEFVARVYYEEIADIQRLMDYDIYEYNNLQEKYVLVGMNDEIFDRLIAEGWRVEIDEEATAARNTVNQTDTFNGGYLTTDEIYAELDAITAANPTLTELIDYGDSYCKAVGGCTTPANHSWPGYDLRAMRVTNEAIPGPKPVFILVADIHAREITTPELAMRLLAWLVDGYGVDADATWLVDWHEVYIVPTVNPDGHFIVELGPYYQRKNANRTNGCTNFWPPSSFSQYGVDLNRNHTFGWNTGGTSTDPCSQTYLGPSAASEPEVLQLESFIAAHIPDQKGPGLNDPAPEDTMGMFITLHSYGDLVLWPWGNITAAAPNKTGLKAIGDKFATFNGYQSCQPSICLYITSGTSDDHTYGELGVPSYTFEVGSSFMPNYSVIDAVQWPENKPAFIYAAKIARTPYMTVKGPDALNLNTNVNGSNLTLTATINDASNGGQTVAGAKYYIDTPPWAGGVAGNMNPSDGSFNTTVEGATATIDVSGLFTGQHIVFIQGADSQGNLGAVSAAFFNSTGGGPTPTPSLTPTPTNTPDPGSTMMHINNIAMSVISGTGNRKQGQAVVTVVDPNGQPVSGATVSGTFTGDSSGTASGVTNISGQVTLTSAVAKNGALWTFCVDNVTKTGWTYNPAANIETCDSTGTPPTATPVPTITPTPSGNTIHAGDLDNASTLNGNNWNAAVVITVHDQNENPVAGAVVSGSWSNGTTGSGSCTTNASGQCTITRTGVRGSVSSVTFTVTNVTHSSFTYQPGSNHDPDGDSNGTVIGVAKP